MPNWSAKAKNGKEALALIRELKPDIAVLDIQMPVKDGFAAIAELKPGDHLPEIIFVTAYQEHAVRAFEVHAVDYLLKPVSFERFREAVRLAKARLEARAAEVRFAELQQLIASLRASGNPGSASGYERELWVRTRDGMIRVPAESIDAITAEGDYVLLHVGNRSHLLKDTISSLASRLDPATHLRVHRSTIINLKQVNGLRRRGPKAMSLTLESGERLRHRAQLRRYRPQARARQALALRLSARPAYPCPYNRGHVCRFFPVPPRCSPVDP